MTASTQTTEHASRVAVVTGGSRGIGRACAEVLGRRGAAVVVGYAGNEVAADAAVEGITATGGQAVAVGAVGTDESAVAELFDTAERTFSGIDVVVHAAGELALSSLVDLDPAVLDDLHRTNIRGTSVVDQQATRRLRPGGAIVDFSTSVVGTSFPTYGVHVASKGAVEALTMILARELHGRDVTVNAVAPGATATDLLLEGTSEEDLAHTAGAVPPGRLRTPEDTAETVAPLSSPAGHRVNGQVVRSNGELV